MKKNLNFIVVILLLFIFSCKIPVSIAPSTPTNAENKVMTPELLWSLHRLGVMGIAKDEKSIIYKTTTPSVDRNSFSTQYYKMSLDGKEVVEIKNYKNLLVNYSVSPNGKYSLFTQKVYLNKVLGSDRYPEMKQSDVKVFDALDYRHWDTWEDGGYSHLFYTDNNNSNATAIDIMKNEKFHCPQKPFGGSEDYIWHPSSEKILYVSKKFTGTEYVTTTNTDIYEYDLKSKRTTNLTSGMVGYDTEPSFSSKGELAWLSMSTDGYEADKNDIYIWKNGSRINLTQNWDGTVNHFKWSNDGNSIYFTAAIDGEIQLFRTTVDNVRQEITQITHGYFDITSIIGVIGGTIYVTRTDMNTAAEIFAVDVRSGNMTQLSNVNKGTYKNLQKSNITKERITTTDGKKMVTWVIYPPNFDSSKKYPTLLYCQGGPQSALSQFYSFRWNFQVMAAQGYIIVAPNRRGMPGHGVQWNKEISKDWGGQVMRDYLSAIDAFSKNDFVDKNRLGAVGASYGGYSVFYLAGIHENRFKSFISHCGVFNLQSMYGTTEEVFFTDYDLGGPYWKKDNFNVQRAYNEFNPINNVHKWNTPILIVQGGKDYRVPIGQGQEAFQAAQLLGVKSRFIYFPEENHWVLSPQNGIIWQREFFSWLRETL